MAATVSSQAGVGLPLLPALPRETWPTRQDGGLALLVRNFYQRKLREAHVNGEN